MQTLTAFFYHEKEIFTDLLRRLAIIGIFIANDNGFSRYGGNEQPQFHFFFLGLDRKPIRKSSAKN